MRRGERIRRLEAEVERQRLLIMELRTRHCDVAMHLTQHMMTGVHHDGAADAEL